MFRKWVTRRVTLTHPAGLHARPSRAVALTVRRFQAKVQIRCGGQVVDAGDILQLLSLGATVGSELVLSAKGPDAQQVLDELARLFADNFGLSAEFV